MYIDFTSNCNNDHNNNYDEFIINLHIIRT